MSNNDGPYEQTGAELDDRFADVHERIDTLAESGGGGHSGEGILVLENLANALEPHLDTGNEGMTREEVEEVVISTLADLGIKGLDEEVVERVRHHAEALDFPARRVGPSKPIGSYHSVDMWGVKFRTGRGCYIRSATVDASESGSFRATLGEYDGETFTEVDSTEISVDEGVQRISLDLEVPEAGEYLLSREGDVPLRRGQWNGWDDHLIDNLRLHAGDKPGYEANNHWYYFFDLEMTANENHEFPE